MPKILKRVKHLLGCLRSNNFGQVASGDGSLAISAAWLAHLSSSSKSPIRSLTTIYMGESFSCSEIDRQIRTSKAEQLFSVEENVSQSKLLIG